MEPPSNTWLLYGLVVAVVAKKVNSKQAQIFYEKIRKYKMGPRKQQESPMTLISQKFKKVKSYHELLYVGRRLFQKDPDVSNH